MNYGETFRSGADLLRRSMPDNLDCALDARLLLEKVCGTDIQTLYCHPEREVSTAEVNRYRDFLDRRCARVPAAYILGEQYFMGLRFEVSPDVLIPNQDTEILAEKALKEIHGEMRILDLCTGSGCILLSLLSASAGCTGIGTDISEGALAVARKNAEDLGLKGRAEFLRGDLYGALYGTCHRKEFQLAVTNPPYIPSAVIPELAPEVREREPRIALDGGADGLVFYRRILEGISDYLVPGGVLLAEIGYDQGQAVKELFESSGFANTEVFRDYGGQTRVVKGVLRS